MTRVVLSFILIFGIIAFVALFTFSTNIDNQIVEGVVEDVVDLGSERINLEGEIDYDLLYLSLLEECRGKDKITFEGNDFAGIVEISCYEIASAGEEGIEELIKEKISEVVIREIDHVEVVDSALDKEKINKVLFILGVINLILMGLIIFLAKNTALVNLGIVGLISGLPFLIINPVKAFLENLIITFLPLGIGLDKLPSIRSIIELISKDLFVNYLVLFILGAGLLGLGIGLKTGVGRIKKDD